METTETAAGETLPSKAPVEPIAEQNLLDVWENPADVPSLGKEELDALPFGAIELDATGTILRCNQAGAEMSGRRVEDVLGKNFFTEVAPSTNVEEFAGRFRVGVALKILDITFPHHFDFQDKSVDVWIRLFYDRPTDRIWVFTRRRDIA